MTAGIRAHDDPAVAPEQDGGLPLKGIRVIDFGQVWAGPYAGQLLAHAGAQVIKVESRQRVDLHRRHGPYWDGIVGPNRSGVFNPQNTGKWSATLNLKTTEGVDLAKRLIAISDGVIENFRPRVLPSLGLGYDDLVKVNPDIILVSISGYGATGAYRDFIAYGPTIEALGGLCELTGYEGGPPETIGGGLPDTASGTYAAFAFAAALEMRHRTGLGQHIELGQFEATASLIPETLTRYAATGVVPHRDGARQSHMVPHGVFPVLGDDRWVALACRNDEDWAALRGLIGEPWAADPALDRVEGRLERVDAIEAGLRAWTAQRSAEDVVTHAQAIGVPAAISASVPDLLSDPHLQVRGALTTVQHAETGPQWAYAPSWRFDGAAEPLEAAPAMGQHNDDVFRGLLGLSKEEVERLTDKGVLI